MAIVETGSLVRASETLNVTQSTVTARLKSLETRLGQTLITRQKSGATPTPAGHRLSRYAQTISQLWKQAQVEIALPDAMSSVCNIGCDPDLWDGFTERMLDYIRRELPHVAISVWQGSQRDLNTWLRDDLIDIAIGYAPTSTQKEELIPSIVDQLILVSTDASSPIKFDPGYIYVEAGEEFGREHAEAYADANVARTSFGNAQMALNFLLHNGGSAYLPRRIAASYLQDNLLYELKDAPVFTRRTYIAINKNARAAWPWLDACLETISEKQ